MIRNLVCLVTLLSVISTPSLLSQTKNNRIHKKESSIPVNGTSSPDHQDLDSALRKFVYESDVPGVIVVVTKNGKTVYSKGVGYARLDRPRPIKPSHVCRIGSLTKAMTSTAVFQLAEQGLIQLDQPILRQISGGKEVKVNDPRLKTITVLQCLQHTSGMKSKPGQCFVAHPRYWAKQMNIRNRMSRNDISRAILLHRLHCDPGTATHYSNAGYHLLGVLIERVSKKPYASYVKANILNPLNMKSMKIGGSTKRAMRSNELQYYSHRNKRAPAATGAQLDRLVEAAFAVDMNLSDSAGGWVGTAKDVITFANSFRNPEQQLINDESIRLMMLHPPHLNEQVQNAKSSAFYRSAGWEIQSYSKTANLSRVNYYHGGTIDSANTYVVCLRNGITWSIFCNTREMPIRPQATENAGTYDPRPAKYLSKLLAPMLIKKFSRVH